MILVFFLEAFALIVFLLIDKPEEQDSKGVLLLTFSWALGCPPAQRPGCPSFCFWSACLSLFSFHGILAFKDVE